MTTEVHHTRKIDIDHALEALRLNARRLRIIPSVVSKYGVPWCVKGVMEVADEWVAAACQAKGIALDSHAASEEIAAGPVAVLRYLQLIGATLESVSEAGMPSLPAEPRRNAQGKLLFPVFPTGELYDSILFRGISADVWMQPHVDEMYISHRTDPDDASYRRTVAIVLGAGNVASIPVTDALTKIFQERKCVLLKMNPVNEYLGPIFQKAFMELIRAGFLRIIFGGVEEGAYAAGHPEVDEVHITGSVQSHQAIVWGEPLGRAERIAANTPQLQKPITSELGNVTPWIIIPGPYSDVELDFQAENVAAMIVNNASFNCIATKMIVTWRGWPDREKFLDKLSKILEKIPPRRAYYPGAEERFVRFTGKEAPETDGTLPWTLLRDLSREKDAKFFEEESFVCVCGETALDAASPAEFIERVAPFANNQIWGTLGVGLMIHPAARKDKTLGPLFEQCVADLRYGTIGINVWPGLSFALMSTPWGGYPGATLANPQSGVGWAHNTYMLDGIEKVVIEGPLSSWIKPLWFPTHRRAASLSWKVLDFYHQPSLFKIAKLLPDVLRG